MPKQIYQGITRDGWLWWSNIINAIRTTRSQ